MLTSRAIYKVRTSRPAGPRQRSPVRSARAGVAACLTALSQAPLEGLPPRQAIELMARIRGARGQRARRRAAELLAAVSFWSRTT